MAAIFSPLRLNPHLSFPSYDVTVDVISSIAWTSERAYASLEVEVEAEPEDDATAAAAVDMTIRSQLKNLGRLSISTKAGLEVSPAGRVTCMVHFLGCRLHASVAAAAATAEDATSSTLSSRTWQAAYKARAGGEHRLACDLIAYGVGK